MKILDKIVYSQEAPKQVNVIWMNPETLAISVFDNGWKTISGAGIPITLAEIDQMFDGSYAYGAVMDSELGLIAGVGVWGD